MQLGSAFSTLKW